MSDRSQADEDTLHRAAVGKPVPPVSAAEQGRLSMNAVDVVLESTVMAAQFARTVDVDLLNTAHASECADQLGTALLELTHLRRRLQRRAGR